jgi:hypothetical protein
MVSLKIFWKTIWIYSKKRLLLNSVSLTTKTSEALKPIIKQLK